MGWVVNATHRPLYPQERPKDIRESGKVIQMNQLDATMIY